LIDIKAYFNGKGLLAEPELADQWSLLEERGFYLEIHGDHHYMPFCNKPSRDDQDNLSTLTGFTADFSDIYNAKSRFKDYILQKSNCVCLNLGKRECTGLSTLSDDLRTEVLMDSIIFNKVKHTLNSYAK
jgi:hypothetical protein